MNIYYCFYKIFGYFVLLNTTVAAELKNSTLNVSATYLGCHITSSTKSYNISEYDWICTVYNSSSSMPGAALNTGALSYPKDIWKQITKWHSNGQSITCTDSTLSFTTTATGSYYIHVYGVKFK